MTMLHFLYVIAYGLRGDPRRVLTGVFWLLRGKRVRGKNLIKAAAARNSSYYKLWIRTIEPKHTRKFITGLPVTNRLQFVAIVVGASENPEGAKRSNISLRKAFGTQLTILSSETSERPEDNQWAGYWCLPVVAGDELNSTTAEVLKAAIWRNGVARVFFWDEDRIVEGSRQCPWVKGQWDELVFLARDGLLGSAAFLIPESPSNLTVSYLGELAAIASATNAIVHVPIVLTHRQDGHGRPCTEGCQVRHITSWRKNFDIQGDLPSSRESNPGNSKRDWPSISIVIATRDRLDLLSACLKSLELLDYPGRLEIIIADNGSSDPETLLYFEHFKNARGKVIDCNGPFNFSSINNRAVKAASGDLVCLLNNDVEALDSGWLSAMAPLASRSGVGAVGAMLLYPDFTIQHAGVAIGLGGAAGHVYRGLKIEDLGNAKMHSTTRRVSAVTAACLLVRRDTYLAVGGLDESAFAVAFNDVDFCMRLDAAGLRNIYVAEAQLVHHESKSRGDDMSPANIERYKSELEHLQRRWGTRDIVDPWHSPLISRTSEDFVLELS